MSDINDYIRYYRDELGYTPQQVRAALAPKLDEVKAALIRKTRDPNPAVRAVAYSELQHEVFQPMKPTFPIGARVLVDGRDEAIVQQVFPMGSSSFAFPHYKVRFVGGDSNVAVALGRVSAERKPHAP